MKNVRTKTLALIGLAALVLAAASCDFPDYQLQFGIDTAGILVDSTADTVTVPYTLENIGSKDLVNAMIRIEVGLTSGLSDDAWTAGVDLGTYSLSESGNLVIDFFPLDIPFGDTLDWAIVTGSAWDAEEDDGWSF